MMATDNPPMRLAADAADEADLRECIGILATGGTTWQDFGCLHDPVRTTVCNLCGAVIVRQDGTMGEHSPRCSVVTARRLAAKYALITRR